MATARHPHHRPHVEPGHDYEATAHLKVVPDTPEVRDAIRGEVQQCVSVWDRSRPISRRELDERSRELLGRLDLPESHLGWTMVELASALWRDQVAAVPYARRLLMLPHCLRNADRCPADYSPLGLLCQDCGACRLTELRSHGERLGYKVMIAEGSPAVMQVILSGHVDAIVGVACLDALEKMFERVVAAGIPCMALPLLANGCRNTSADADWIVDMVSTPYRPAAMHTPTYLHLMRLAARLCEPEELARLAPPTYRAAGDAELDAELVAATETIAYEFLHAGGKHSRPLITLATYDALTGALGTSADGAQAVQGIPDAVRRLALAIEVFHKASLVHDDIEDDDEFRYGRPALHRTHGPGLAINVGDYLIGLGYRLIAGAPADAVGDILAQMTRAHARLCAGQGAELAWRKDRQRPLTPLDVLKMYALKTAPAFEAALYSGVRLAGDAERYLVPIGRFARHLGVGYQIVNDLEDWHATAANKRRSGSDILGGRPTILLAMALEKLPSAEVRELRALLDQADMTAQQQARVESLYRQADVFATARALVDRHYLRALDVADAIEPEPLRRFLRFLAGVVLGKHE